MFKKREEETVPEDGITPEQVEESTEALLKRLAEKAVSLKHDLLTTDGKVEKTTTKIDEIYKTLNDMKQIVDHVGKIESKIGPKLDAYEGRLAAGENRIKSILDDLGNLKRKADEISKIREDTSLLKTAMSNYPEDIGKITGSIARITGDLGKVMERYETVSREYRDMTKRVEASEEEIRKLKARTPRPPSDVLKKKYDALQEINAKLDEIK